MGNWTFCGGQIWIDGEIKKNDAKIITVNNEMNKEFILEDDDIIIPGFYDLHCHLWGQNNAYGKGSLISMSPDHLLSTGIFGCSDAGSFGYNDWENAERIWSINNLQIKSWINIIPESLTTPGIPYTRPEDIDKELLVNLLKKHKERLLGVKLMHGLVGNDVELERAYLKFAVDVAREAEVPLMVHLTGSALPLSETISYLKKGDILSHIYNYGGPGGIILDEEKNVIPEVINAQKNGILLELSSAFRHFSFEPYGKAHEIGLEPDIIATDNNLRDFGKQPLFDITNLVSKVIAAGMNKEMALKASIDTPRKLLGYEENYDNNLVLLKYVPGEVIHQDTTLEVPEPICLKADWIYKAVCGIYQNNCVFLK